MKEGMKSMLGLRSMRGEIPLQEVCVSLSGVPLVTRGVWYRASLPL